MTESNLIKGHELRKRTEGKNSLRMIKVLLILKQHSDINHRLTQSKIMEYLKKDPNGDLSCNPKTLSETIHELIDAINPKVLTEENSDYFTIRYSGWRDGVPERITNIYYMPVIKTCEAQNIAEGILRLDTISREQKDKIIKKLENEYKINCKDTVDVAVFSADNMENVKENTELIIKAITSEQQISFNFRGYNYQGEFDMVRGKNGKPKNYIVNPYYVVSYRGKRYLLANTEPYNDVSIYRVDLICNITLLGKMRRMINDINEFRESKDPQKFMEKHLNMMYGSPITVVLNVNVDSYTLIHDFFGESYKFSKHVDKNHDEITVCASEKGIIDLAMTAPDKIEIVRPGTFRKKIIDKANELLKKYGGK